MPRLLLFALGFWLLAATPAAADQEAVRVDEVLRSTTTSTGQPITLPPPGAEVVASLYTIAAGARLPVHKHPYTRYAYVLSGRLRVVEEATGEAFEFGPGDFVIEMTDAWHWGSNPGEEPLRLLVIDQTEPGTPNTVLKP
jgi:quercetin dioxygenase-like cupin family protein